MREFGTISGIYPEAVGPELFDQFCQMFPEGVGIGPPSWNPPHKRQRWVHIRIELVDHRMQHVSTLLKKANKSLFSGFGKCPPEAYSFRIIREFDESDLSSATYIVPGFDHRHDGYSRDEQGRIKVNATTLPRKSGFTGCVAILVSDSVRRALTSAALQGVQFRPTSIGDHSAVDEGENEVVEYDGRTWWELTTDVILPPICLGGGLSLLDCDGQPVRHGDFTNGCFLREGAVQNPELRYRASDLSAMAPFDIARTFEIFGNRPYGGLPPSDDNRLTVVSQRFYQVCRSINEKVDGSPVRIVAE
jgi:hypothetical protein